MSNYENLKKVYSQFVEGEPEDVAQVKGRFVCPHVQPLGSVPTSARGFG